MNNFNKRTNFFSLNITEEKNNYINETEAVTNILNSNKLVIVSGMKNIGKIDFIKEYISKTDSKNSYYYFNKSNDIENKMKSNLDLLKSLNEYIQLYKIPKIIILQNISKINGIKDFISYLYKEKFKVILLGNDIKIGGIKEIEILSRLSLKNKNIDNILSYGLINTVIDIDSTILKKQILKLLTNDIFLNSIFKDFSVKSIELYTFTLTFLSENNLFYSLRDLQKQLDNINKISLKTTIDYIDFSLQAKILKRCYRYDIKNDKEITSKAKYYFTDNGIRNSLNNFKLSRNTLLENLIYNILEYNNFKIYSGINGKFEFNFYGKKDKEIIFIHISKQVTKDELKKEINKLNKIKIEGKKYLLVESIEKLGIKKVKYDSVFILETLDFIQNFKQK